MKTVCSPWGIVSYEFPNQGLMDIKGGFDNIVLDVGGLWDTMPTTTCTGGRSGGTGPTGNGSWIIRRRSMKGSVWDGGKKPIERPHRRRGQRNQRLNNISSRGSYFINLRSSSLVGQR